MNGILERGTWSREACWVSETEDAETPWENLSRIIFYPGLYYSLCHIWWVPAQAFLQTPPSPPPSDQRILYTPQSSPSSNSPPRRDWSPATHQLQYTCTHSLYHQLCMTIINTVQITMKKPHSSQALWRSCMALERWSGLPEVSKEKSMTGMESCGSEAMCWLGSVVKV